MFIRTEAFLELFVFLRALFTQLLHVGLYIIIVALAVVKYYNIPYIGHLMRVSKECEIAFFTGFAKFSRALI